MNCFRRSLELNPDDAVTHSNLGNALKDQGSIDEAIACFRRSLELEPQYAVAQSNLLMTMQYQHGVTLESLAAAHAEFDRQQALPLLPNTIVERTTQNRRQRPRLGFVSADLARHPVGYFLVRVLENLHQAQYEIVCYSDRNVKDDLIRTDASGIAALARCA